MFKSVHKDPPQDIIFGIIDQKLKLIGFVGLTHIDWKNSHSEIAILLEKEGGRSGHFKHPEGVSDD